MKTKIYRNGGRFLITDYNKVKNLHAEGLNVKTISQITGWSYVTCRYAIRSNSYEEYCQTTKKRVEGFAVNPAFVTTPSTEKPKYSNEMQSALDNLEADFKKLQDSISLVVTVSISERMKQEQEEWKQKEREYKRTIGELQTVVDAAKGNNLVSTIKNALTGNQIKRANV